MAVPGTITDTLERAVARFSTSPWMTYRGETRTFSDLGRDVDRITAGLVAAGVEPGERVGVFLGNCFEWLEVEYAATAAGGWLVPINTMLAVGELAHIVGQSEMTTLLWCAELLGTDAIGRLLELVPELAGTAPGQWESRSFPSLRQVVGIGEGPWPEGVTRWSDLLDAGAGADPALIARRKAGVTPDDVALVMYTSGTTGSPKGALIRHGGIVDHIRVWCDHLGLGPDDRSIMASPLFWSFGCTINAMVPLFAGSAIVLEDRFNAEQFLHDLVAYDCTHLQGVPTQYELALAHPDAAGADLSKIRLVQIGGSSSAEGLARRILDRMPNARLLSSYGLTEAVGVNTFTDLGDPLEDVMRTVGHPTPDNDIELRSVEDRGQATPGEVGEIWLRGPHVMAGYFANPKATAEAIVDGWLRTGDLATADHRGYLTVVGRRVDAYKRGGMNVYPAEVEGALLEHEAVAEAAVIPVPDELWGQVGVAFVVPRTGVPPDPDALTEHCRRRLAAYKVPASLRFVPELPRTPTGKVQKFKLAEAWIFGRSRREPVKKSGGRSHRS